MDLPKTADGNYHVVVFQDYLTKWPLVFSVAEQKAITLAKLLVEEVVPFCGLPARGVGHHHVRGKSAESAPIRL